MDIRQSFFVFAFFLYLRRKIPIIYLTRLTKYMINKTLISVYPSCLSTLVHKDITLKQVYDIIRNDEVLRQRTVNYRKAIDADLPAKQLKKRKA